VRTAAALALLLLACSRKPEAAHAARPIAPALDAGAVPAKTTQGADISWLIGTWEREAAPKEWLLFNAPKEVGVLSGTPPALVGRGEFIPNGPKEISLFFHSQGGGSQERVLLVSPDRTELHEKGVPGGTYRRGAPP